MKRSAEDERSALPSCTMKKQRADNLGLVAKLLVLVNVAPEM